MKTSHTPALLTPQRPIDGSAGIHVFLREPHFGESYWTRLDGPDLLAHALVLGLSEKEVRERAELICRAVNSHADLVAALTFCANYAATLQGMLADPSGHQVTIAELSEIETKARLALQKSRPAQP